MKEVKRPAVAGSGWPDVQLRHSYYLCRIVMVVGCPAVVAHAVAEHWQLKPEVSWVRLPVATGLFTFLYFHLITSKFQHEARCSEHIFFVIDQS